MFRVQEARAANAAPGLGSSVELRSKHATSEHSMSMLPGYRNPSWLAFARGVLGLVPFVVLSVATVLTPAESRRSLSLLVHAAVIATVVGPMH